VAEFKLHCFCQSGNAFKVASMLNCTKADWEPVLVDFMKGATRDASWRASTNEMGEAPVLDHKGLRLTQSGVILDYLAGVTGQFGGRNEAEKREIWRWVLFDNHKFTSYLATYRFMKAFQPQAPDPAVLAFLKARAESAFGIVEKHLGKQPFIVGDRPTIADLSLSGYVFYPIDEHGFDFAAQYPGIDAWRGRIKALPGWKEPYATMPGERIQPFR